MSNSAKQSISAIDLFCGAGGLTSGLSNAGIQVVAGIDTAENCRFAFESNNPGSTFIAEDVSQISKNDLMKLWAENSIRLLAGCAPCQPFSTYSQGNSVEDDHRYPLLAQFERLINETSPELVSMENVPNLRKQSVFHDFVSNLEDKGYTVAFDVVNASNYQMAQSRNRLVLLASRISESISVPAKSATKTTLREAIGHFANLNNGERDPHDGLHRAAKLSPKNLERIKISRPGGSWHDWPEHLKLACHKKESGSGYTPVYGRMSWDDLAPTITTQCYNYGSGRFGHPEQNRAITLREAAVLQGFSSDYIFEKSEGALSVREIAKMIGNAVPVGLGRAIGEEFLKQRQ